MNNGKYNRREARRLALENLLPFIREQEKSWKQSVDNSATPDPDNCKLIAEEIGKIRARLERDYNRAASAVAVAVYEDTGSAGVYYFRLDNERLERAWIRLRRTIWNAKGKRNWKTERAGSLASHVEIRLRLISSPVRMAELAGDVVTTKAIQKAINDYLGGRSWFYAQPKEEDKA